MRARSAFALVELVVVMTVLVAAGAAISEAMRRQQLVFRSISSMVSARNDVRDAAEVLAADLLSASPLDTLPTASDSAVEFWDALGAAVSCDSGPGYTIRIPPHKPGAEALASLSAPPDTGDVLLLFNSDSVATSGQSRWDRHRIAAVTTSAAGTSCPAATGLTTAVDSSLPAYVFTLHSETSPAISPGTPVRILRRTRYSLYRSSDGRWYLGYRRCNTAGPGCGQIQPLSGPYAAYSGSGASGVYFHYLDDGSYPLFGSDARSRAAAIQLTVRGLAQHIPHGRHATFADSASITVALRNRD